jgi:feruloyl esterase
VVELLKSVASGAPRTCTSLTAMKLPWGRVRSAEEVATTAESPAHCTVITVIDKEIEFQVDLPAPTRWNQKFLMGGSGGFLGDLQNGARTVGLHRGYATGVTDAGHKPSKENPTGADWAYRSPERLVNFGHRGTHLAAVTAKLIIQAYYGRAITRSYFAGTSGSGRQAMMEAQRYPMDFDGISAGCPGFNQTKMRISSARSQQLMYRTEEDQYAYRPVVLPEQVKVLDAAVQEKCDAIDGLKDGLITDPRACNFDPRVDLPRCGAGDAGGPSCFTDEQVNVIAQIHEGPFNSTGRIWPGFVYGGESIPGQWSNYLIGAPKLQGPYSSRNYLLSNETFRYFVYGDPSYDLHSFDLETDIPATLPASQVVDANDPDLGPFNSRGGKLIMWIGWNDWAANGSASAEYMDRVFVAMGGRQKVMTFARLFMLPGVGHCSAIDPSQKTPNVVDFLTALEQWVERGIAPDRIIASHAAPLPNGERPRQPPFSMPVHGAVDRTRPLCAYPDVAVYKGTGSADEAANFTCRAPAAPAARVSR